MLSKITGLDLTHFILLGDLMDAAAASVHPDEVEHALEDEYRLAHEYLLDIRRVLPGDTKLVWCLGNHDDNIQINDSRRTDKSIRSLLHWNNHWIFGEEFKKWQQIPYVKSKKGLYKLGQVVFYHGYDCGANSDELEGLQMNYLAGGHSWGLTVRGHTHRPIQVTQAKRTGRVLLPQYFTNVGSIGIGNKQPNYMKRKDVTQWGVGLLVGEAKIGKNRRYRTREWDAELHIKDKN
jgi:predicted phosphodiesterase